MRHLFLFILVTVTLPASSFSLAATAPDLVAANPVWLAANASFPNPVMYNGGTMAPRASVPADSSNPKGNPSGNLNQIELEVTVDYHLVSIKLSADALQLAGFQHLPESDSEQQALRSQLDRLQESKQVFLAPDSAQCSLDTFNMKTLQKAVTEGGMTLEANYQLSCNTPRALRRLEFTLFQTFDNISSAKVKLDNQQQKKTTHIDGENRFLLLK